MPLQVEFGDGTASTPFDASGSVSPVPDWAGAAVAAAFEADRHECGGAALEHVYRTAGTHTARVRVGETERSTGGRYDELVVTTSVKTTVRRRTLAQVSLPPSDAPNQSINQSSFNNGMIERKPTIHKILYIG